MDQISQEISSFIMPSSQRSTLHWNWFLKLPDLILWLGRIQSSIRSGPSHRDFLKSNFDVAVRHNFVVAAVVLSDSNNQITSDVTSWLPPLDVNAGKAQVALLAFKYVVSSGCSLSFLKGSVSLIITLAINKANLLSTFAPIIEDIHQQLHLLQRWTAIKISRSANHRVH